MSKKTGSPRSVMVTLACPGSPVGFGWCRTEEKADRQAQVAYE